MSKATIVASRIEITGGIVTDSAAMRFFLSLIDSEGGEAVLWDGPSYSEAILEAEECADDWGVHVVDRVIEGGTA